MITGGDPLSPQAQVSLVLAVVIVLIIIGLAIFFNVKKNRFEMYRLSGLPKNLTDIEDDFRGIGMKQLNSLLRYIYYSEQDMSLVFPVVFRRYSDDTKLGILLDDGKVMEYDMGSATKTTIIQPIPEARVEISFDDDKEMMKLTIKNIDLETKRVTHTFTLEFTKVLDSSDFPDIGYTAHAYKIIDFEASDDDFTHTLLGIINMADDIGEMFGIADGNLPFILPTIIKKCWFRDTIGFLRNDGSYREIPINDKGVATMNRFLGIAELDVKFSENAEDPDAIDLNIDVNPLINLGFLKAPKVDGSVTLFPII